MDSFSPGVVVTKTSQRAWFIWLLCAVFVAFQFFLQNASAVIVKSLMADFNIREADVGFLSSAFFYAYLAFQLPVGVFYDLFSARKVITLAVLVLALGCLLFCLTTHFWLAFLGRMMMGGASAFAFVGLLYLIGVWFPPHRFALVLGLAETLGMLGTAAGEQGLSVMVNHVGWRHAMMACSITAVIIAVFCVLIIRDSQPKTPVTNMAIIGQRVKQSLKSFVHNPQTIRNGIYCGLIFSTITAYSALWSVSFFQVTYGLSLHEATNISSMVFIGLAFGLPVCGWVSNFMGRRRPILTFSAVSALIFMSIILYVPHLSIGTLYLCQWLLGFSISGYLLVFAMVQDLVPVQSRGVALGLTNMFSMMGGALIQPLIGSILMWHGGGANTGTDFRYALTVLPIGFVVALLLTFFIKETSGYSNHASSFEPSLNSENDDGDEYHISHATH